MRFRLADRRFNCSPNIFVLCVAGVGLQGHGYHIVAARSELLFQAGYQRRGGQSRGRIMER